MPESEALDSRWLGKPGAKRNAFMPMLVSLEDVLNRSVNPMLAEENAVVPNIYPPIGAQADRNRIWTERYQRLQERHRDPYHHG